MSKFILIIAAAAICIFAQSQEVKAGNYVSGYFRSNGTYVAPHYRSSANSNFYDNYSTKPNVNPYTGKTGTRVTPPSYRTYRYSTPTYRTYRTPTYRYYTPSYRSSWR